MVAVLVAVVVVVAAVVAADLKLFSFIPLE